MFGIDLGINLSSVSCVSGDSRLLDFRMLKGEKYDDDWTRVVSMVKQITDALAEINKNPDIGVIKPWVAIELPIYSSRNRNVKGVLFLSFMYALLRFRLEKRGFKIYAVNPITVKTGAKKVFGKGRLIKRSNFGSRGKGKSGILNKKGMIAAYEQVTGTLPPDHTIAGRETIADSFFIARAGQDRRKINRETQRQSTNWKNR